MSIPESIRGERSEARTHDIADDISAPADPALSRLLEAVDGGYAARHRIGDELVVGPRLWAWLSRFGTPAMGRETKVAVGAAPETARMESGRVMSTETEVTRLLEAPGVRELCQKFRADGTIGLSRPMRRFIALQLGGRVHTPVVSSIRGSDGTVLIGVFVERRLVWLELWSRREPRARPSPKVTSDAPSPPREPPPDGWWSDEGMCPTGATVRSRRGRGATGFWCESSRGVRHGPSSRVADDGVILRTGWYWNGRSHGAYEERDWNGTVLERGMFLEGERHGTRQRWWKTGAPREIAEYRDGELHGPITVHRRDGSVRYRGNCADGERDGLFVYYDEHGGASRRVRFRRGERVD